MTDVVLERKEFPTDAPISVSNLAANFVDQDQLEQALIEAAEANEAAEEAQQRVAELELEVAAKAGERVGPTTGLLQHLFINIH